MHLKEVKLSLVSLSLALFMENISITGRNQPDLVPGHQ